jgi:hypothetical protein
LVECTQLVNAVERSVPIRPICGNTNRIQWLLFRPAAEWVEAQLAAVPIFLEYLRHSIRNESE